MIKRALLLVFAVFLLSSCAGLSPWEKARLAELEYQGVKVPHEDRKSPVAAGLLNILPGAGNVYLAVGTEETYEWLSALANALTWPWSIIWGVPEGVIDARVINKRYSIHYYTYGPGAVLLRHKDEEQRKVLPPPDAPRREPQPSPPSDDTKTREKQKQPDAASLTGA